MRLSMWILADWLKDYRPRLRVEEGKRTLRNARLYTEGLRSERSTVYVGNARDFIGGAHGQIICANGHDMLFLDADDINQVHNDILDAFEFYNGWSDALNERLKTEYSLQDLLADSTPVIHRPMMLADASYYVYAQTGMEEEAEFDPELAVVMREHIMTLTSILSINRDKRVRINNPRTYDLAVPESGIHSAVRNLFFRGEHRGWLITKIPGESLTQGEMDVQDELGDIVERWMEYHQNQKELSEKSGVFLQILEGTCARGEDAWRRIESLNWKRNDEMQVYFFRQDSDTAAVSYALDRKLEQLGAAFALHFEENLILIVNCSLTDIPAFERGLTGLLNHAKCTCGRSPVFTDIFRLKPNYELAKVAAEFGDNRKNRVGDIESAALPYYMKLIVKNSAAGLTHPALRLLREYDDAHQTALYQTLEAYLQWERNYVKTAEALFVHRNTLLYRIERIRELTGADLDAPDIRLHILLSYKIARTAGNE